MRFGKRHELCISRTLYLTNSTYHLQFVYQLQAVQSAMVPFIVYITDCICHEQYVSQTLYISPVRQSSACCGARWCASSLEARWCWQEYRGGGGGRRVQDARSRVRGSGASPVTTNMAAAPKAASPAPPAW